MSRSVKGVIQSIRRDGGSIPTTNAQVALGKLWKEKAEWVVVVTPDVTTVKSCGVVVCWLRCPLSS
jgi:hypothetical protein